MWVEDDGALVVRVGGAWLTLDAALGLLVRTPAVEVARAPSGAAIGLHVEEELLSGLSGASVTSTIAIPDRAIVLAVSTRTVAAVLGATSWDCGIAGEPAKFGGSLGVAARKALADVGLEGPEAAVDIRDLRTLLASLRMARRTAWQTIVRLITTGLLLALIAGVAVKLKVFG